MNDQGVRFLASTSVRDAGVAAVHDGTGFEDDVNPVIRQIRGEE